MRLQCRCTYLSEFNNQSIRKVYKYFGTFFAIQGKKTFVFLLKLIPNGKNDLHFTPTSIRSDFKQQRNCGKLHTPSDIFNLKMASFILLCVFRPCPRPGVFFVVLSSQGPLQALAASYITLRFLVPFLLYFPPFFYFLSLLRSE